ncbi:CPXCG motif-containing cysteine-rich protein [Vibrio sp.]|nr:CPXCG motif-containing cysteine-rich protein [Vibrio sp.]
MFDLIEERMVECPYCCETLTVLINREDIDNDYIEDCQVCCKPILFQVSADEANELTIDLSQE